MSCSDCPDESLRTNGADALTGPPCCHGITPECNGYPTSATCPDHACCPDPCQHSVWNHVTCPAPCCHHVPKAFCAQFTPDSPTDFCIQTGYKSAPANHSDIGSGWGFLLPGVGTVNLSVETGYDGCQWRLRAPDHPEMDVSVPIEHSGEFNCRTPPPFVISGVSYPVLCDTCTGSYSIVPYDGSVKIPFQSRFDCTTAQTAAVECGSCSEVPTVLCVLRLNPGTPPDLRDPYLRTEFAWDYESLDPRWVNGSDYIDLIEYEGQCYLEPHIAGLEWLLDEMIEIDPDHCAVGMHLHVERYGTNELVEILGAPCSMFKFLCGNCRCICRDVCMVGMQDGEPIDRTTLTWNGGGWSGDGEYGPAAISLVADENGNCQVQMTGFDPVSISNTCGNDLVWFMVDPENPNNWRIVYCKECAPCDAGGGDCRTVCPDIPMTLFACFEFISWEVAFCGPAEGPPPTEPPCVEPFCVPMFLVRAAPEASIDWFWIGRITVPCRTCSGAVSDPQDSVIEVMLDCSGMLTVGGSTWSVTIPCGCEGGEWNIEVLTDPLSGGIGDNCCSPATVKITITE